MPFDPSTYGEAVADILDLDGGGERLMPLAGGRCSSEEARSLLSAKTTVELFRNSRAPDAALSGLWLYFSCYEESHSLSQDILTPEGSFWHGILHRQEPDPGNAGYWFRRAGQHPVFLPLMQAAEEIAEAHHVQLKWRNKWDPFAFIDYCEQLKRGSLDERVALEIQRAEWQLLFDYCARPE